MQRCGKYLPVSVYAVSVQDVVVEVAFSCANNDLDFLWQVLVMELNDEAVDQTVVCTLVDILQDQDTFKWKGHERLNPHEDLVHFPAGFQPFALVQCQPPAVVTSLALHTEWKLVTFGTSHGFGLYDYQQKRSVMVRSVQEMVLL